MEPGAPWVTGGDSGMWPLDPLWWQVGGGGGGGEEWAGRLGSAGGAGWSGKTCARLLCCDQVARMQLDITASCAD